MKQQSNPFSLQAQMLGIALIEFSHCSSYSRYGCWGLSEDITHLDTPKWRAIAALTGIRP